MTDTVRKALEHTKVDYIEMISYIGNREGTPYGLLQTQRLIDEALTTLATPSPDAARPSGKTAEAQPTELDPKTVEACAKVLDERAEYHRQAEALYWKQRRRNDKDENFAITQANLAKECEQLAAAIRALIPEATK